MTLPGLMLIHGGLHASDCWSLLRDELASQEADLPILTVDLPGRRNKPCDPSGGRIAAWADSVVADIDAVGLREVVVAGHSIAGLTVPSVIAKLGVARVREVIFIAAVIPPQGN